MQVVLGELFIYTLIGCGCFTVSVIKVVVVVVVVVVVDALFVVTNFGGTMNNVSPTFSIPDHLQYFVCRQVGPVCNVVDPGTWWSAAWDCL